MKFSISKVGKKIIVTLLFFSILFTALTSGVELYFKYENNKEEIRIKDSLLNFYETYSQCLLNILVNASSERFQQETKTCP